MLFIGSHFISSISVIKVTKNWRSQNGILQNLKVLLILMVLYYYNNNIIGTVSLPAFFMFSIMISP